MIKTFPTKTLNYSCPNLIKSNETREQTKREAVRTNTHRYSPIQQRKQSPNEIFRKGFRKETSWPLTNSLFTFREQLVILEIRTLQMQQGPFAEEQTKMSQVQLNTFATAELNGLVCAILFIP